MFWAQVRAIRASSRVQGDLFQGERKKLQPPVCRQAERVLGCLGAWVRRRFLAPRAGRPCTGMITTTITIQQGNLELSGGCRSVSNRELGRIIIIDVQVRLVSECCVGSLPSRNKNRGKRGMWPNPGTKSWEWGTAAMRCLPLAVPTVPEAKNAAEKNTTYLPYCTWRGTGTQRLPHQ
jgi:hypothetical protein